HDDGVGPTLVGAAGYFENAQFLIGFGTGFHEGDVAVGVVHIETAIGVGDGGGASALVGAFTLPLDVASLPVRAERVARIIAVGVDEIADDDIAAMPALQLFFEVNPFFFDGVAVGRELHEAGATAIAGAGEDVVTEGDGIGNVGSVTGEVVF